MTWKRVATAAVLIPGVVALVLAAPTAVVAIAIAAVMLLALFEFFAIGDAIGHRAYRFWTGACGCMLVFVQYLAAMDYAHSLSNGLSIHQTIAKFISTPPDVADVLFIFLIGLTVITLATKRPLVEVLPA